MKKITSIILGLSVMIALVFVPYISKGSNVQSSNPFTEWDTLSDAEAEAGFSISLPDQIEGYDEIFYRASKTHPLIEVIFHNGEGEIRFRKAPGNDDISGNYTPYTQVSTVDGISLKGDHDAFSLAIWTDDEYTYSIYADQPFSQDELLALAKAVQ